MCRIITCAWRPAKGILVFEKTTMANTARFASRVAQHWISGEHAKALRFVTISLIAVTIALHTGANAVTLLTPSYGGI